MGVQDREWWREHYREQRRREVRTGQHRFNVRGSARPLAAPWFARRSMAWAAILISVMAVASSSNPGQRLIADVLGLGGSRTAPTAVSPPPPPSNTSPVGPTATASESVRNGPPFPQSGSVVYSRVVEEPTSRLHLVTRVGDDRKFVARLYDIDTEDLVATIYLLGGHQVTVRAPFGTYRLKIASGRSWLGERELFGMGGRVDEALAPVMFYPTSNGGTVGQTVMISGVVDGNLPMRPIATRRF